MAQEQVDLNLSVGYALKHAAAALRGAMDAALRPLALSVPQYACLDDWCEAAGFGGSRFPRTAG